MSHVTVSGVWRGGGEVSHVTVLGFGGREGKVSHVTVSGVWGGREGGRKRCHMLRFLGVGGRVQAHRPTLLLNCEAYWLPKVARSLNLTPTLLI